MKVSIQVMTGSGQIYPGKYSDGSVEIICLLEVMKKNQKTSTNFQTNPNDQNYKIQT